MLTIETERVNKRNDPMQWRAICSGPAHPRSDYIRYLRLWCEDRFGPQRIKWHHTAHIFYFTQADQAMLFKLRWHGVDLS